MKRLPVLPALVVLAVLLAPQVLGNFGVSLMNDIGIGALVALGLVMLTGVGGATSFGQAAFVGIAAYATAWLTTRQGASPWLGLLLSLVLTGGAAVIIGLITLRLGGHFLPLSTIAWGLSIALLFGNVQALGSHTGLSNIPPVRLGDWSLRDPRAMYYLVWLVVGLACCSRAPAGPCGACAAATSCCPASAPIRCGSSSRCSSWRRCWPAWPAGCTPTPTASSARRRSACTSASNTC
jgi:ABC-type branched-subunit amino acid transport system permease subunit